MVSLFAISSFFFLPSYLRACTIWSLESYCLLSVSPIFIIALCYIIHVLRSYFCFIVPGLLNLYSCTFFIIWALTLSSLSILCFCTCIFSFSRSVAMFVRVLSVFSVPHLFRRALSSVMVSNLHKHIKHTTSIRSISLDQSIISFCLFFSFPVFNCSFPFTYRSWITKRNQ